MTSQIHSDIKPFYAAIGAALEARGKLSDDFKRDVAHEECRYVVRMCQRMVSIIDRPDVGLNEVLRVERCASGHYDYQRKFAMYCQELKIGRSPIQADTSLGAERGRPACVAGSTEGAALPQATMFPNFQKPETQRRDQQGILKTFNPL